MLLKMGARDWTGLDRISAGGGCEIDQAEREMEDMEFEIHFHFMVTLF